MKKTIILCSLLALGVTSCSTDKTACKNDLVAQALEHRHSSYSYDPTRTISQDQIACLLRAAQLTPSSYNDQPWYFIIGEKKTNPGAYAKVLAALVPFNQEWAKNAPVLIVSIASTNSHNNEPNRWAQYDTGAAAFSLMLQATSLGLAAHQMGGFDEAALRGAFSISSEFVPMSVMAIGYEAPDRGKTKERVRKPLSQNFFFGNWQPSK